MIQIPGYRIIRLLGKGGMAEVYLAIQESFGREVALKVLSPTLAKDPSFSERFLREARIVSRLVHPNIVTVYDVGVADGRHYLSMEYIPGTDLKHARARLNLEQRLAVVKDIARALAFAGRKGYVHRDVKPENILLHEDDGRAVLMDFGIARASDFKSGMTQIGTAIGTPHYMSPEQAKGQEVDPRSDLYSLGVVLFFLLSGRVPYDADSIVAVGVQHVAEPIPQLPESMQRFQSIIDRAMAKDPAHRFQSGDELVAALEQVPLSELEKIKLALQAGPESQLGADTSAPTLVSVTPVVINKPRPTQIAPAVRVKSTSAPLPLPRPVTQGAAPQATGRQGGVQPRPAQHAPAQPLPAQHQPGQRAPGQTNSARPGGARQGAATGRAAAADTVVAGAIHPAQGLWPWLAGGIFALLIAYVVYFQQQLPVEQRVDLTRHLVAHWRAVAQRVGDDLLAGLSGRPKVHEEPAPPAPEPEPERDAIAEAAAQAVRQAQAAAQERTRQLLQAQEWLQQLESQPDLGVGIVRLGTQLLQQNPDDAEAAVLLERLQQRYQWLFDTALASSDTEAAGQWLAQQQHAFGEQPELQERLRVAEEQIARQQQISTWLSEAAALAERRAWTQPEDNSALQRYRQVLALEPGNAAALEGIERLLESLEAQARQRMNAGQWREAQRLLQAALGIDGENRQLQGLLAAAEQQQQVDSLMRQARELQEAGKLLSRSGDSVYRVTGQVLQLDPDQTEALAMRQGLEDGLVASVESLLASARRNDARAKLASALAYFPSSERLLALKGANEAAISEASRPRVEQLRVSSEPITDLRGRQVVQFPTVQQLHVGFLYSRFDAAGETITAHLYEGADATEVTQIPVTVTRSEGEQYFLLTSPQPRFAADAYRLELRMGKLVLAQLVFRLTEPAANPAKP